MKRPKLVNGMITPLRCPDCGGHLIIREVRATGNQFLGCENYPECRYTRAIPEDWMMRLEGQPELFGEVE